MWIIWGPIVFGIIIYIASIIDKKIEEKKQWDSYTSEQRVEIYNLEHKNIKYCPKCLGTNWQFLGEEIVGATPDIRKVEISRNINPLKPFTKTNVRERVIPGYEGEKHSRFLCLQCGNIFE